MALPNSTAPVAEPLPDREQSHIKTPEEKWSNKYALSIVTSNWAFAESYRTNAHDWRYRNADELYLGWSGQDFWEGTRVPKSSLGVYVTFEQIQSMLAKTVPSATATDSYHFSAKGTGAEHDLIVLAWRELVLAQLGETRFRQEVKRALHSMKLFGNGVLEWGFEDYEEEYIHFESSYRPKRMGIINHPLAGPMQVPIETEQVFKRIIKNDRKARPYIRYVSVKDLYVDPNLESPNIHDAQYVIKRVYMGAGDVKALAKSKDFKIPDDAYLTQLSKAKSTANQDVTKLAPELFRYNMWNPNIDYSAEPAHKRIAVVEYTTSDRKIWWLQGGAGEESIIYNQPNRYGAINFYSTTYADVLDRWHALAVSDVCEGEHRLQKSIINGRINELALALHPPMLKKRGVTVPWYQLKRAPGRVTEVENPKDDILQAEIPNITQSAYVEVQASEMRVQRITGMSDLAGSGTPTSGGNSANRTATGVNTQAGATQDRMSFILDNIEDDLIERIVNQVVQLDRKFLDVKQASNWLKMDTRFQQLDPLKVMNTKVMVDCRVSSKMRAKSTMLQVFPQFAQIVLNPEFVQLLAKQKQKLNVKAMMDTAFDGLNYTPRESWFMEMTPQEVQALNQPPAEVMAKLQMQQQQNESDQTIEGQRAQVKLIDTVLKQGFDHHAQMADLDDKFILEHKKLAAESERADADRRAAANRPASK